MHGTRKGKSANLDPTSLLSGQAPPGGCATPLTPEMALLFQSHFLLRRLQAHLALMKAPSMPSTLGS